MSAPWPPPVGTLVTVRSVCCGRETADIQFEWDGNTRQFTGKSCSARYAWHEPLVSATWTAPSEAAS